MLFRIEAFPADHFPSVIGAIDSSERGIVEHSIPGVPVTGSVGAGEIEKAAPDGLLKRGTT
jgi:hypothetical protein